MCVRKEKEERHEQETVNAHGEDSSENRLIIMGSLRIIKVVFDEWREIYFT